MKSDPDVEWRSIGMSGVTARIRGEIIRVMAQQRLRPGDRLPSERELATYLGASRPSVREAIQFLQAEGRVTVRHGAGIFVADSESQTQLRRSLTAPSDVSQLYDMREAIEVPAARWAAERQLPELAAVRSAFDAMDAHLATERIDWDEMQRLDADFHTRIVLAAGNTLLEQTQSVIYDMMLAGMLTTLSVSGRLEESRQDHLQILTALEEGDVEAAGQAARSHVAGARGAALHRIRQA